MRLFLRVHVPPPISSIIAAIIWNFVYVSWQLPKCMYIGQLQPRSTCYLLYKRIMRVGNIKKWNSVWIYIKSDNFTLKYDFTKATIEYYIYPLNSLYVRVRLCAFRINVCVSAQGISKLSIRKCYDHSLFKFHCYTVWSSNVIYIYNFPKSKYLFDWIIS